MDRYRVETDGSMFVVTKLCRRYWLFGEWMRKPITCGSINCDSYSPMEPALFRTLEEAQQRADHFNGKTEPYYSSTRFKPVQGTKTERKPE